LVQVLSPGPSVGLCVSLVTLSVCPVHCGKMADYIYMLVRVVGRLGLRMRQVLGIDSFPTQGVILGVDVEHSIVTDGEFVA